MRPEDPRCGTPKLAGWRMKTFSMVGCSLSHYQKPFTGGGKVEARGGCEKARYRLIINTNTITRFVRDP